jgi:hypothetical protein
MGSRKASTVTQQKEEEGLGTWEKGKTLLAEHRFFKDLEPRQKMVHKKKYPVHGGEKLLER